MSKLLLVIDDDPVERTILERVLVGAGHRVMTAGDGQEGRTAAPADIHLLLQTIAELTDRA